MGRKYQVSIVSMQERAQLKLESTFSGEKTERALHLNYSVENKI